MKCYTARVTLEVMFVSDGEGEKALREAACHTAARYRGVPPMLGLPAEGMDNVQGLVVAPVANPWNDRGMTRKAVVLTDKERAMAAIRMSGDDLEYRVYAVLPNKKAVWIDKDGKRFDMIFPARGRVDPNAGRVIMTRTRAIRVAEAACKKGGYLVLSAVGYLPGETFVRCSVWSDHRYYSIQSKEGKS